ncbi:Hpt domain-containing protein [Oscillibacter sp.]|uniref:Hpt domain-containing protein n=1 Tax=Oscillibacter sp. TaxID=1945593 RepID=UPI002D800CD5|nr:Hpt domain-containing protein [Oscillibacter sp.]
MTLQECYAAMSGNYEDAIGRLRSERLVQKFVLKFLNDGSYDLLCRSLEEKNYEEAFRAAHTIKGVCQNLSIDKLQASSSRLCEALRNGYTPEADALAEEVRADYAQTVTAIQAFQKESAG